MTLFDRAMVFFISLIAAVLGGLIVYLVWYSANDPGHGRITGKEYSASYVSCSGNPVICVTYPECYDIKYTDGHHNGDKCVTPREYEQYKVGDDYPGGNR